MMPAPKPRVYYQGNTMIAEVADLKDEITNILLPAAVVTAWIVDAAGTIVPGSTITLNVVVAGLYQGLFPHTLALIADTPYTCVIRADTGNPVQRAEWTMTIIPELRYA